MKTMKRIAIAMVACFAMMAGTGSVLAQNDGPSYEETGEWLEREFSSIGPIQLHDGSIIHSHRVIFSDNGTIWTFQHGYDNIPPTDQRNDISIDIRDVEIVNSDSSGNIFHPIELICMDGIKCVRRILTWQGEPSDPQYWDRAQIIIIPYTKNNLTKSQRERLVKIPRALRHLQKLALEKKDLF